jgi:hypothetical protein
VRVFFSVEAAYVCRGQRLQLHVTESGGDVFVGDVGVVGVSRLFDGALYVIRKPTVQVLADRELPGVVEEAAVSVRQIARRLSRSSLLILAGGNSRIVRRWGRIIRNVWTIMRSAHLREKSAADFMNTSIHRLSYRQVNLRKLGASSLRERSS